MPRRPTTWPPVIADLGKEMVEVAKRRGVHGRLRIRQLENGDYVVALVIPASETVSSRFPTG